MSFGESAVGERSLSLYSENLLTEREIRDLGIQILPSALKTKETISSFILVNPENKDCCSSSDNCEEQSESLLEPAFSKRSVNEEVSKNLSTEKAPTASTSTGYLNEDALGTISANFVTMPTQSIADNSKQLASTKDGPLFSPVHYRQVQMPSRPPRSMKGQNIYGFDIDDILKSHDLVRKIIETKIQQGHFILRCDRQAVAAVLIDAVILNLGTSPSKQALEQLAKHLVDKYPQFGDPRRTGNGWEMWFFHAAFGPGATGFLEDRLKNQRKILNIKKPSLSNPLLLQSNNFNWKSENESDNEEPDPKLLTFMKHNFGDAVKNTMMDTVFGRRSFIRRLRVSGYTEQQKIMECMPRLFDTEGMIVQDFNARHPGLTYVIYDQWPRVSKLLMDYAEQSGISYAKKLSVEILRYDMQEEDVAIVGFCLLPFVMPLCGRKVPTYCNEKESLLSAESSTTFQETQGNAQRKRKTLHTQEKGTKRLRTVKASDMECLKSLIIFKPKNTHVADVLNENKKKAPFILALGTVAGLKIDSYFVIIHKVAIPCGTRFLIALDTCFKCFTVLSIPFPLESYDHWVFIDYGVAGKPYAAVEVPPVVQALVGQIISKV